MVLISSKKYACETCIKGHRSSACKHTDRPLFEIKKKGRPVTQCEHCRELRKTKQVHVKCMCEYKEDFVKPPSGSKKCNIPGIGSAAFPNGLPQALEASVALQSCSEGTSSDSDHGGDGNGCMCKFGGDCHCCTPRKSAPRNQKTEPTQLHTASVMVHGTSVPPSPPFTINARPSMVPTKSSSHILARIAELRPVLPRPTRKDASGPLHNSLSGVAHSHASRHHLHENMLFSPYGRAYDMAHELPYHHDTEPSGSWPYPRSNSSNPEGGSSLDQYSSLDPDAPWQSSLGSGNRTTPFPSTCGCGNDCACPGCPQHSGFIGMSSSSAFSSCANPGACATCLDCTILSLPSSLPPDTALSIYDAYQAPLIDDWIRQVSSLPTVSSTTANSPQAYADIVQSPSPWSNINMPQIKEPTMDSYIGCGNCGNNCRCPPGLCECQAGDYHCMKDSSTLTFATSGERASCCSSRSDESANYRGQDTKVNETRFPSYSNPGGYLGVPQVMRSRASSSSSQSSRDQALFTRNVSPTPLQVLHPSREVQQQAQSLIIPTSSHLMMYRSPSSSTSPSGSVRGPYAISNTDSEGSIDSNHSPYDHSFD